MLKDKKITICITGGISAYKSASLVSFLVKEGVKVQVIMTKHATEFITPLTLQTLSKNKVIVDMFDELSPEYVGHIHFSQDTDLIVVVPATANILGKVANGIADDMVSSTIIASTKPILFAPAMNEHMYKNKIVKSNIGKLKEYGYRFVGPAEGYLACGTVGIGKLVNTKTIIEEIERILE